MNNEFSYFSAPVLNTRPTKTCGLREIYELIRSERWAKTTERLRSLQSATQRREYKAYNLDYVTFSGVFTARRTSALRAYSHLICLDIDHVGTESEVRELQQRLENDTCLMPRLMFRSPSGDGLKIVIQSASKSVHITTYNSAVQHIQRTYGVQPDNTPDIARACFLCYDPHAYYREMADDRVEITDNPLVPRTLPLKQGENIGKPMCATISDYERIDRIVRRIEHRQQDVTTPYRKWFRIGLALASTFGEQGRPLYHRISRFYHRYTPHETELQYTRCLRYTNHTSGIGSLIYLLNSS